MAFRIICKPLHRARANPYSPSPAAYLRWILQYPHQHLSHQDAKGGSDVVAPDADQQPGRSPREDTVELCYAGLFRGSSARAPRFPYRW